VRRTSYLLTFLGLFFKLKAAARQASRTVDGCSFLYLIAAFRANEMLRLSLSRRAALLATTGSGKVFQLVKLLLSLGKHKLFTALATGQVNIGIF
jgi:hypothetical protein